jgi:tetratricopeptide (TPR) repeat protein
MTTEPLDEEGGARAADAPELARAQELLREGRTAAGCAEYLRYADACIARGDAMEAVKYFYKAEDYQCLDIKNRRRLADLLAQVGNKSRAVANYVRVVEDFISQGLVEDATATLLHAITTLPERLTLRYRLAELFAAQGQTQKAVNVYLQVLDAHPDEVQAWEALAQLYGKRHATAEAADAYLHAIRVNEAGGNLFAAAQEYEALLPLLDDRAGALKRLVEIYGSLGFKAEMVQKILELARLAEERGEKERALMIFSKVLDLDPANEEAQLRLGKSIQVVSILPTSESLLVTEAPTPDEVGAEPEPEPGPGETSFPPGRVIRTVDDLLGFHPDAGEPELTENPQVCYDLGLAYLEMGITQEAIHYLQLASRDTALRVRACNMLGLCFLQKDMPEMAAKEFERGLATPGLGEAEAVGLYYNLAAAYERLGELGRALDGYRKVYAIDINYLDVREKLRRLQAREGT